MPHDSLVAMGEEWIEGCKNSLLRVVDRLGAAEINLDDVRVILRSSSFAFGKPGAICIRQPLAFQVWDTWRFSLKDALNGYSHEFCRNVERWGDESQRDMLN